MLQHEIREVAEYQVDAILFVGPDGLPFRKAALGVMSDSRVVRIVYHSPIARRFIVNGAAHEPLELTESLHPSSQMFWEVWRSIFKVCLQAHPLGSTKSGRL